MAQSFPMSWEDSDSYRATSSCDGRMPALTGLPGLFWLYPLEHQTLPLSEIRRSYVCVCFLAFFVLSGGFSFPCLPSEHVLSA